LSNIPKLLTILTLIVFTCTFRLVSMQADVQDDILQPDSGYDASESTADLQGKCDAEDNDIDDQDIDLVFLNEEPKQNLAKVSTQQPSGIFSNICFKPFNRNLVNPYWETLSEKMESPGDTLYLTSLPLRSPPFLTV
jgi:hypothetical protein